MRDIIKRIAEKVASTNFPRSTKWVSLSWKEIKFDKQDFAHEAMLAVTENCNTLGVVQYFSE